MYWKILGVAPPIMKVAPRTVKIYEDVYERYNSAE